MKSSKSKSGRDINQYVYYTGLGFQMIAVISLFTFIGYKLDQGRDSHTYTVILSLLGVCISLISSLRSIMKRNKEK